jgi:hypothetical protein
MKKAKRATNKRTGKRTKQAPKHPGRARRKPPTIVRRRAPRPSEPDREVETSTFLLNSPERPDASSSPVDTGGDVDADWHRAQSSGEEAVGGTVATPDQDVVDEIARPLGVERSTDSEVITSDEILSGRDRKRWRLEQSADERARDTEQP